MIPDKLPSTIKEPWHIRYVSGDNPTAAVIEYTTRMNRVPPTPPAGFAPVVNLNIAPPIHNHKALQEALKAKGFYKGNIDGQMNQGTTEAIKAFKAANKLSADSVVGPKVKKLLGLK